MEKVEWVEIDMPENVYKCECGWHGWWKEPYTRAAHQRHQKYHKPFEHGIKLPKKHHDNRRHFGCALQSFYAGGAPGQQNGQCCAAGREVRLPVFRCI